MSAVADAFTKAFGRPDPAAPNGLHFGPALEDAWQSLYSEMGAGWFRDGFLYMFGEGLDALEPCLEAWSFLVPPCDDRIIFGRNAYGAILVLDNANDPEGGRERVFLLDPVTVTFDGDPRWRLRNVISNWMPRGNLPTFTDDSAYRAWKDANGVDRLDLDDVLGIKVPKPLGGELVADNLQLDGIVEYYQTTAPIYAAAFAKLRSLGG